jgi:glycosyltransferase involved in cell wall biosynthesis
MSTQGKGWPKISVLTPTYNAASTLPRLVASLQEQTDHNFEWVVSDGNSNDGTLELLLGIDDLDIRITSRSDCGIYDAKEQYGYVR